MRATALVLSSVLLSSGCASREAVDLVFLTREGCVLTDQMRTNLDAALTHMGNARLAYRVVHLASFPANDPRRGYPTPTILHEGRDLFGLPTPVPPVPGPDVTELPGRSSVC